MAILFKFLVTKTTAVPIYKGTITPLGQFPTQSHILDLAKMLTRNKSIECDKHPSLAQYGIV